MSLLHNAKDVIALNDGKAYAVTKDDIAITANGALVAAVTSKRIVVVSLMLLVSTAVNLRLYSGTSSGRSLTGLWTFDAAGKGLVLPENLSGWFETDAGEALHMTLSGAATVGGCLSYYTAP